MKIIVLYGPTGVGKTALSIKLAKKYDAEIISCDSMQIYKYLDIGSAKITKDEMQGIAHHLIDFLEPNQNYSVFDFVENCKKLILDIQKRGKNVIIVGGTGLYIKALTENYNLGNVKNHEITKKLQDFSNEQLVNIIEDGGKAVKKDDLNNRIRLLRYAELAKTQSKTTKNDETEKYLIFGLICDRVKLYDRINSRVDEMINKGLVNETKAIYQKYGENIPCFKAIGYKELLPYIKGESHLDECVELIKKRSRNYAKRQFTFMNQFNTIIKIDSTNSNEAFEEISNIIDKNKWQNKKYILKNKEG